MKKILLTTVTLIMVLFLCSWKNIETNHKYKLELELTNDVEVFYYDTIDEIKVSPDKEIYNFTIYELSNNQYEVLFNLDLRATTFDNNNATHGKAFPWGYQVYFNHQTMEEINSYSDINAGISTVIGALSGLLGHAGVAVGALIGLLQIDWAIANRMDNGSGVTLTNVLYVTPVHWWNSGNCIRNGWF